MLGHVLTFAFLMVIASTAVMTPILLYIFDLRSTGWLWQHAALFSAMIAPTDAVSVSSVLKKGALPLYSCVELLPQIEFITMLMCMTCC